MPELYEYVTTAEASERTRYSARQIHKLCEIGRIRFKKQSKNKTLVNLNDVCQYANAHPVKVLDTYGTISTKMTVMHIIHCLVMIASIS